MNPAKKPGSKPVAKSVTPNQPIPEIAETDGSYVDGNIWVRVGLSRDQNRILMALGTRVFRKRRPPTASAVRMLVLWGLAHLEEIEDQLEAEIAANRLDPFGARRNQFAAVARAIKAIGVASPRSIRKN